MYKRQLQKRGYSLIKTFPIASKEDFKKTKEYEGRVDYFLFDTRCEGYGGSGKRFDWSILTEYKGETPFLLSGGTVSYTHLDVYKRQGLDYPGIGPIHANLSVKHRAQILAVDDDEALEAAFELTRLEGIIPALESAHALGALAKVNFKPEEVVVLTVSGRGRCV